MLSSSRNTYLLIITVSNPIDFILISGYTPKENLYKSSSCENYWRVSLKEWGIKQLDRILTVCLTGTEQNRIPLIAVEPERSRYSSWNQSSFNVWMFKESTYVYRVILKQRSLSSISSSAAAAEGATVTISLSSYARYHQRRRHFPSHCHIYMYM